MAIDHRLCIRLTLPDNLLLPFVFQAVQSELKDREHLVVSTLDQARTFLSDQPIEGPGEPRKNLQPKSGQLQPVFLYLSFDSRVTTTINP